MTRFYINFATLANIKMKKLSICHTGLRPLPFHIILVLPESASVTEAESWSSLVVGDEQVDWPNNQTCME